ncbi:MAG: CHAT domain-containing protein [Myxococcota bacterium]
MDNDYYTLSLSIHRYTEAYQIEISHSDPQSDARVSPLRGGAAFDMAELRQLQANPEAYGKALAQQVFSDREVEEHWVQVETAAQASGHFMRVLVCIDRSAQELQGLRWELLRHPRSGDLVSTSQTILLSRFMVSRDWRPVKLRARSELTALIAVSAPDGKGLQRMKLAPVDFEREVAGVKAALGGIEVQILGGPGSPLTLKELLRRLRLGIDIVYLVSHGKFGRRSRTPALILQDEEGEAVVVKGEDLAARIGELPRRPRLMVLASCQSAGDGEPATTNPAATISGTSVQATLAGRLADAGVPAIIAMQGLITMHTVEQMMPELFRELLVDGQIDRALSVARGRVLEHADSWMPALYTRLLGGRLWYTPGFRGDASNDVWRHLLKPVADGKVVPIIGPRVLEAAHGASHDTAVRLAGANHYPFAMHEWEDLPRVTEYMAVKESRYNVVRAYQDQLLADLIEQHRSWLPPEEIPPATKKPKLGRLLALVGDHLRARDEDPHRILAELPASVYVTTNFDPLLEWSLRANDRTPQRVLTRWRYQKLPQSAEGETTAAPTAKTPLVFHVFGAFGAKTDDGLVLTEDDYFDYLITATAAQLIPPKVESALVDNSLLFLGFRLTDWHFRVLFRLMMNLPGRDRLKQYRHVAVQLDPDLTTIADIEAAKAYLAEYFGKEANIDIYWGSSEDFLVALRDELKAAGDLGVDHEDDEQGDGDEWDF